MALRYNHCVNVVRFKGTYYASWNANIIGKEGIAGQYVMLSNSDDYFNWSEPVRVFTEPQCSAPPISNDSQWQPGFINWQDETLFCAWCTHMHGPKLYISHSRDGSHWTTEELPNAPDSLMGRCMGFPTNRGLITKTGRMIFPCSMPPTPDAPDRLFSVGATEYSALIMSDNGGKTWYWSEPIRTADWADFGEDPAWRGTPFATTWEPMVYDMEDGRLGLLVRNSTTQEDASRPEKSHQMLFYATSKDDGMHWTQALPVDLDTLCSRNYTVAGAAAHNGLYMVMNDHPARVPVIMSRDRYYMGLFVSPVPDPNLLLPGPLLVPVGRAFYPDGFIKDDKMYWASSHGNIINGTVEPLPDFTAPFLMRRESRQPPELLDSLYTLPTRPSTLCVVMDKALTLAPAVTIRFEHRFDQWVEDGYPILTLGGKTRSGMVIRAKPEVGVMCVEAVMADGQHTALGEAPLHAWNQYEVTLGSNSTDVTLNGRQTHHPIVCLRKVAFGGLYDPPSWPMADGSYNLSQIKAASIALEG
jgi:hypothetical protein